MNAWIESFAELMNLEQFGLNSLNAGYLLPDAKTWGIGLAFAAFCMFCIWDHTHAQDERDRESHMESK